MISLTNYREFWEGVAAAIPEITELLAVTMDDGMSKRITALKAGDVALFYLPPSGEAMPSSDVDSFSETNICVVFVMERYDPQRRTAADALESSQPVIEAVKRALVDAAGSPCSSLRVDPSTINTLPETSFYAGFAGWSIGFKILD